MGGNRKKILRLAMSFLFILYVTTFSRVPTLSRVTHLLPLWSYTSHRHWKQILLNIALFIPLGYFLSPIFERTRHPRLWPLFAALLVSASVELTQFLTYLGMMDVDDLVSNVCGATIGILIYTSVEKHRQGGRGIQVEKWMPAVLIAAGLIGCIIVNVGACHREQFVNKCLRGLTGTALRCIIRKIVYMRRRKRISVVFP